MTQVRRKPIDWEFQVIPANLFIDSTLSFDSLLPLSIALEESVD